MSEAIREVRITPVAFRDPPLLNAVGVHQPFALRAVVEVETGSGLVGLGETYGDRPHLRRLERASRSLIGTDVFDLHGMWRLVDVALAGDEGIGGHGMSGMVTSSTTTDRVFSPFEVAALDAQGKLLGRPVSDLLGGAVRRSVPFSAYLFAKWAGHPGEEDDRWGAALDAEGIVAQARLMQAEYGFGAIKLKAGVFPPQAEVAAVLALRAEFPDLPLRLDPNAAWTVQTSIDVGRRLEGVLEYVEDPTPGIEGMAEVAPRSRCRSRRTCAWWRSTTCRRPSERMPSR
ncbi:glucarate dehydratase [Blastococcus saxobsidens DD2]|uniref:glucarate dehydratase n=1 Tax=Blastococcus saxobsidens (strain DD2) TaxID=1146883 RepID=H6RN70_BLASD|nr:enolase C-terminal domain-like protein [Blastococcus saxobsidens]CCG02618.1 glucarate dehydratase [Blastococcus saxobsidens DD2]